MLLPAVGLCTSCGIQSFRRVACITLCARWLDRGRLHGVLCFIQYGFGFAVFHERFPHQRRGNDRHDRDDRRDPLGGKEVAIESRPKEWNYDDIVPGQGKRQRYLMYRGRERAQNCVVRRSRGHYASAVACGLQVCVMVARTESMHKTTIFERVVR